MHLVLMKIFNDSTIARFMKEETTVTKARATTNNPREPKIARIILLRLNTAYVLVPHTAISRKERRKKQAKSDGVRMRSTKLKRKKPH